VGLRHYAYYPKELGELFYLLIRSLLSAVSILVIELPSSEVPKALNELLCNVKAIGDWSEFVVQLIGWLNAYEDDQLLKSRLNAAQDVRMYRYVCGMKHSTKGHNQLCNHIRHNSSPGT
jgi:hypothetical protein